MNIEEYKKIENEINEECQIKLHNLRLDFVEQNRKYNIGDFVFNVTGIIKVDYIGYEMFREGIEIVYSGYRYKKNKGEIIRTKDRNISSLWESNNLKLLK